MPAKASFEAPTGHQHDMRIRKIEDYARSRMTSDMAHDFKHVDRVRRWAVAIAEREGYAELDRVETAALLHDLGLSSEDRQRHAQAGAELASAFLTEQHLFAGEDIAEIANAIQFHSSLHGQGQLLQILRDADTLDLLGPIGLMRAFTSKHAWPEYEAGLVKGETWGWTAGQFTERFAAGVGTGHNIVDQINFQISCFDNLNTASAREFARPLVEFMHAFMAALDQQVNTPQSKS
jgi:hypothetical protein